MAETVQPQTFLSTKPAGRTQWRVALAMMAVLLVALAVSARFAALSLARVEPFIPAYESVLIINDGITAALLYAQYAILRRRGMLILATAYLITALIVIPHMMTFPGVFAPTGLLGAGLSSTAWLYIIWHGVFPTAVIAYAFIDTAPRDADRPTSARNAILASIAVAVGLVCFAAWLATAGAAYLPALMADATHQLATLLYPSLVIWFLAFAAFCALMWRRRSVLDLWLAVALCALFCEITLGVILVTPRFSVGFYLGRVYSTVAASVVLVLLLFDTTALYAQLARAIAAERVERERRLAEMEAMLSHLSRVGDLGSVVTHLIHEVNQPLAAIGNYLSALQRLIAMGDADKVGTTIDKTIAQSERARDIMRRLRDFVAKREIERKAESLATTIEDAVAVAQAASGRIGVEIAIALDPRARFVIIDRIQIEQVLVNLIRNASEAMMESPRRKLAITSSLIDSDKIELSIADTGPGLPAELRERLFQPFVTTKATGMGIGLSVCRFIVEAHGEKLQVADNPGGGTVFRFTLPVANDTAASAAQ